MYLVELQGHFTSAWPSAKGAPTECMQGTKAPSAPSTSYTAWPMRVMMRWLTATYALSLNSIPMWAMWEPKGPIEKGTTYMVRPFMQPSNKGLRVARMSWGAIQLLVGPAFSLRSLHI